jgi:hypothetical protein
MPTIGSNQITAIHISLRMTPELPISTLTIAKISSPSITNPTTLIAVGTISVLLHTTTNRTPQGLPHTRFLNRTLSEAVGNVPREQEHHHDHQHQPQAATGAVAPISAVAPSRQAAHEQHDQNNQQEQTHWKPLSKPGDSYERLLSPETKKADVAEHPKVFDHVGLLFNKPLGKAGVFFI